MDHIEKVRKLVKELIDQAYDTGWYAGSIEHGRRDISCDQEEAIEMRNMIRDTLDRELDVLEQLLNRPTEKEKVSI